MSERDAALFQIAEMAVEALAMADAYLDGFVWITEPEASELETIKAMSKQAQRMLDEVRGTMVKPAVMPAADGWQAPAPKRRGQSGNHQ